jgi:hydrogenase maturation protease
VNDLDAQNMRINYCATLVAGLGNILLSDDGVGVHAVKMLSRKPPHGVVIADVGTAILEALPLFEDAQRVLIIDAMQAGGQPGEIYHVPAAKLGRGISPLSLHQMGVIEALRVMQVTHPPHIELIGVEPVVIDYGSQLSHAVQHTLPTVVARARAIVNAWANETSAVLYCSCVPAR